MELVEGEELKGPVPLDTALDYAGQIASALEAAHDKGITHRDLKPANIKVTPQGVVKVLDFGLAKIAEPSTAASASAANSPTLTIHSSQVGLILGTAAYMSPEQVRGQAVDKRADIWAFGVVLWEMLTGRQMFEGETVSDIVAAVLRSEPDLNGIPPRVQPLLTACLEKDPRKRLRDIGDWRRLLAAILTGAAPSRNSRVPWIASSAFALACIAVIVFMWRAGRCPPDTPFLALKIEAGDNVQWPALSRDGWLLAFVAND